MFTHKKPSACKTAEILTSSGDCTNVNSLVLLLTVLQVFDVAFRGNWVKSTCDLSTTFVISSEFIIILGKKLKTD